MEVQGSYPGLEAPVHRALIEPILLAGAPRSLAIAIGTLSAALGLGLNQRAATSRGSFYSLSLWERVGVRANHVAVGISLE